MGWVLLLVMAALLMVTFVTWRLMISAIDVRMDAALRLEIEEFEGAMAAFDPRTGEPFTTVEDEIDAAIAYNITRPNEQFLGYVDGKFYTESQLQPETPDVLAGDEAFGDLVGSVTKPVEGSYQQPEVGEVRYLAIPVGLQGDPVRGVLVAAFHADALRADADEFAELMLVVGAITMLGATAAAWLFGRADSAAATRCR
jgi:hypothetical protein